MSSEVVLLTYKELAQHLGVKLASARQTVSRRRWKRFKGNDGSTRIEVPSDYLERSSGDVSTDDTTVDATIDVFMLKAENNYLHQRVVDLQDDRDAWKNIAQKSWWRRLIG